MRAWGMKVHSSGENQAKIEKWVRPAHVDKTPQGECRVGQEEAPGVADIPEFEKTDPWRRLRSRQRGEWESMESGDREMRVFRGGGSRENCLHGWAHSWVNL